MFRLLQFEKQQAKTQEMDSGNSGSMQSSSGGEEEYDSRTESISSFLNSSAHFGSLSDHHPHQQQQPPPPLLSHRTSTLFSHHHHPHSQNLDAFQQALPNPSGNTAQFTHQHSDMLWSRGLRSDHPSTNYGNFGNITALSSSSSSTQSVLNVQGLNQSIPSQSSIDPNAAKASNPTVVQSDHHHHQPNPVKNPKKRTRASRRAPTTVLTTDTSNFRQMVQEFTGIPTSPFSAGSPYSRRLDLFSTGTSNIRSAAAAAAGAGHLDSLGPLYPLRPSAQKVHQLSPSSNLLNPSSMIDSLVSNTTNSSGNAVIPSQNILNMQNQMLSFQANSNNNNNSSSSNHNTSPPTIPSFLQHPSSLSGKSSRGINNTGVPSFDELGLGHHENVNASLSSGLFPNSSERWRSEGGGGAAAALNDHNQHLGNFPKFNCSAATTSDFLHHEKGLENVTSGGDQGTVGSWICPSD